MTLATCLAKARHILAGGWSEPLPRTSSGAWTCPADEGVHDFDLFTALCLASETPSERADAYALLEAMACPATRALDVAAAAQRLSDNAVLAIARAASAEVGGLEDWLGTPNRKLDHVLGLFDMALRRTRREAA